MTGVGCLGTVVFRTKNRRGEKNLYGLNIYFYHLRLGMSDERIAEAEERD